MILLSKKYGRLLEMRYQSELAKELESFSKDWTSYERPGYIFEVDMWEHIVLKLKEKYDIKEKQ